MLRLLLRSQRIAKGLGFDQSKGKHVLGIFRPHVGDFQVDAHPNEQFVSGIDSPIGFGYRDPVLTRALTQEILDFRVGKNQWMLHREMIPPYRRFRNA